MHNYTLCTFSLLPQGFPNAHNDTHDSELRCFPRSGVHLLPVLAISQPSRRAADVTEEPSEHLSQSALMLSQSDRATGGNVPNKQPVILPCPFTYSSVKAECWRSGKKHTHLWIPTQPGIKQNAHTRLFVLCLNHLQKRDLLLAKLKDSWMPKLYLTFCMCHCNRGPPLSCAELFTQLRVRIMSLGTDCFPCMAGINASWWLNSMADAQRCTGSYLNQGSDDPGLLKIASIHSR